MRTARRSDAIWLVVGAAIVVLYAWVARPTIVPGVIPGYRPDSPDYVYGALALLEGRYEVDWSGEPRIPRYPPGYSWMLVPAVAFGGADAAVWVPYISGLCTGLLAAAIGATLRGPRAIPIVLLLVWLPFGIWFWGQRVMSDVPAAALTVLLLFLLIRVRTTRAAVVAGALAGAMVWLRLPLIVVPFAAALSLGAWHRARSLQWYFLAVAAIPVGLLGVWQLRTFGHPLVSGYQAVGASASGSGEIEDFFGLQYVMGLPFRPETLAGGEDLANLPRYVRWLAGEDVYLALPGMVLAGLTWLVISARRRGPDGVVARFGLSLTVLTLALYVPYFWQGARFLLGMAAILNLSAALAMLDAWDWLRSGLARRTQRGARQGA